MGSTNKISVPQSTPYYVFDITIRKNQQNLSIKQIKTLSDMPFGKHSQSWNFNTKNHKVWENYSFEKILVICNIFFL